MEIFLWVMLSLLLVSQALYIVMYEKLRIEKRFLICEKRSSELDVESLEKLNKELLDQLAKSQKLIGELNKTIISQSDIIESTNYKAKEFTDLVIQVPQLFTKIQPLVPVLEKIVEETTILSVQDAVKEFKNKYPKIPFEGIQVRVQGTKALGDGLEFVLVVKENNDDDSLSETVIDPAGNIYCQVEDVLIGALPDLDEESLAGHERVLEGRFSQRTSKP